MSTAPKGRTHDCKRPAASRDKTLAIRGPSTHDPEQPLLVVTFTKPATTDAPRRASPAIFRLGLYRLANPKSVLSPSAFRMLSDWCSARMRGAAPRAAENILLGRWLCPSRLADYYLSAARSANVGPSHTVPSVSLRLVTSRGQFQDRRAVAQPRVSTLFKSIWAR